jgi:hypothetical protein
MTTKDYWSVKTNPKNGEKYETFYKYLKTAHNGNMDVDDYCFGEWGAELVKRLEVRFTYESNIMGEAAEKFYESLRLKAEIYNPDDFYDRWMIFTPVVMYSSSGAHRKYPIVFSHHGGGASIEDDIFSTGYINIAGKEEFIVVFLQNTNWENMVKRLDEIASKYPVDLERVYISGFSQGSYQTHSAYFRVPEKFAAVAPCSSDIFRPWDNFDKPYTETEYNHLREVFVPYFQMVGSVEASSFVPLTLWRPRKDWGLITGPATYKDPRANPDIDPTRMHGEAGYVDPARIKDRPKWSQCTPPKPPEGADIHEWMMGRINKRMWTLGCEERDPVRCVGFENDSKDELHHIIGIYGDKEDIRTYYGYKHYVLDILNKDGIHAFRYVVVQNNPHHQSLKMGDLAWEFFKKFRRDSGTGKIVEY